jgi:hypothetical protein
MDSDEMHRAVTQARRGAPIRAALETLRRGERQEPVATAESCLRQGQDPERRLEPLRRRAPHQA